VIIPFCAIYNQKITSSFSRKRKISHDTVYRVGHIIDLPQSKKLEPLYHYSNIPLYPCESALTLRRMIWVKVSVAETRCLGSAVLVR
jgi:hypothetical protein